MIAVVVLELFFCWGGGGGGGGCTVSRNHSHTWLPYQACDSGTVIFVFCLPGMTGGSKHFQEITVTDATVSPL